MRPGTLPGGGERLVRGGAADAEPEQRVAVVDEVRVGLGGAVVQDQPLDPLRERPNPEVPRLDNCPSVDGCP
jgi:hypothetical protein